MGVGATVYTAASYRHDCLLAWLFDPAIFLISSFFSFGPATPQDVLRWLHDSLCSLRNCVCVLTATLRKLYSCNKTNSTASFFYGHFVYTVTEYQGRCQELEQEVQVTLNNLCLVFTCDNEEYYIYILLIIYRTVYTYTYFITWLWHTCILASTRKNMQTCIYLVTHRYFIKNTIA